jgi:hypothetical protein
MQKPMIPIRPVQSGCAASYWRVAKMPARTARRPAMPSRVVASMQDILRPQD